MAGSIVCDSMRNSPSDTGSCCSYDGFSLPSQCSPTFREPNGIHQYLPPMDDERMRIFAVMAFDLLAADDKLHSSRVNFACPSYDCKQTFPRAKELIRHIPFCQKFSAEKVYCNVCDGDDCFEAYRGLACASPKKKKPLSTMTRILNRLSVSRPSSRHSSHCDEMIDQERASIQSGQGKVVAPPSPPMPRDLVSPSIQAFEMPLVELSGKEKPQELENTQIPDEGGYGSSISPSRSVEAAARPMWMDSEPTLHSPQEDLNMSNFMSEWGESTESAGSVNHSSFTQSELFPSNAFASDSQSQMGNDYFPSLTSASFDDASQHHMHLADPTPAYLQGRNETYQGDLQSFFEQPNPAFLRHAGAHSNHSAGGSISHLVSTGSCTSLTSHSASISPLTMAPHTPAFSPSQESRKNVNPHYSSVTFIPGLHLRCEHYPDCQYFTTGGNVTSYPSYLKKHMETHQNAKFRCSDCGKPFKRGDNLVTHKKNHCHPQVLVYQPVSPDTLNGLGGDIPRATGSLKQRQRRSRWKAMFRQPGRRQGRS